MRETAIKGDNATRRTTKLAKRAHLQKEAFASELKRFDENEGIVPNYLTNSARISAESAMSSAHGRL